MRRLLDLEVQEGDQGMNYAACRYCYVVNSFEGSQDPEKPTLVICAWCGANFAILPRGFIRKKYEKNVDAKKPDALKQEKGVGVEGHPGSMQCYRRGCRQPQCKAASSAYMREYAKRRKEKAAATPPAQGSVDTPPTPPGPSTHSALTPTSAPPETCSTGESADLPAPPG